MSACVFLLNVWCVERLLSREYPFLLHIDGFSTFFFSLATLWLSLAVEWLCVSKTCRKYQYLSIACDSLLFDIFFISALVKLFFFFFWSFPQVHIMFRFQFVMKKTLFSPHKIVLHIKIFIYDTVIEVVFEYHFRNPLWAMWPRETAKSNIYFVSCAADNASSFTPILTPWVREFNFTIFFSFRFQLLSVNHFLLCLVSTKFVCKVTLFLNSHVKITEKFSNLSVFISNLPETMYKSEIYTHINKHTKQDTMLCYSNINGINSVKTEIHYFRLALAIWKNLWIQI